MEFLFLIDGNTSDVVEFRKHLEKLAGMLEDLREVILIADSKLCTGETLCQAHLLGFNLVTLVRETWGIRSQIIAKVLENESLPEILTTADGETYHGISIKTLYIVPTADGSEENVLWRFLAIHSSQLQKQRQSTNIRNREKERKTLTKQLRKLEKTIFACETDAQTIAQKTLTEGKFEFHTISFLVERIPEDQLPKPKGRPRGDFVAQEMFRLVGTVQENSVSKEPFSADGMFVLMTTISDKRKLTDRQILEAYKGQNVVEMGFHWMKGPLEVEYFNPSLLPRNPRPPQGRLVAPTAD